MTTDPQTNPDESNLLDIATNAAAPAHFLVTDSDTGKTVDCDMFDYRHLTDAQEIRFNQMVTRDQRWGKRLAKMHAELLELDDEDEAAKVEQAASDLELQALEQRISLITMMTTCPEELARKLSSFDKTRIVKAVSDLTHRTALKENPELAKAMAEAEAKAEAALAAEAEVPEEVATFPENPNTVAEGHETRDVPATDVGVSGS